MKKNAVPLHPIWNQVSVYVPDGMVRDYQEAGGWSEFSHFYTIESMQGIDQITHDQSSMTVKVITDNYLYITWLFILPKAHSYPLQQKYPIIKIFRFRGQVGILCWSHAGHLLVYYILFPARKIYDF